MKYSEYQRETTMKKILIILIPLFTGCHSFTPVSQMDNYRPIRTCYFVFFIEIKFYLDKKCYNLRDVVGIDSYMLLRTFESH